MMATRHVRCPPNVVATQGLHIRIDVSVCADTPCPEKQSLMRNVVGPPKFLCLSLSRCAARVYS